MSSFIPKQASKIICIGRNYADHAAELNNPIPTEPLLFIKPNTTIQALAGDIKIPQSLGEVHHELEIAIVIGSELKQANTEEALQAISGIGLALDLTLRDVQTKLKDKGQPWEKAKSFDGACPIECMPFRPNQADIDNLSLNLTVNGTVTQHGNTSQMLFKPIELIAYISQWFTLLPNDIVLTGTPAGVGKLQTGDILISTLNIQGKDILNISSNIY